MNYYLLSPFLNSPLLTYQSKEVLEIGEVVDIQIKQSNKQAVVIAKVEKPDFICKEIQRGKQYFLPHQRLLANFIAQYYCAPLGLSYNLFTPTPFNATPPTPTSCPPKIQLSQIQQEALKSINSQSFSLLFGETGSGKSEIYIHFISQILQKGQSVILLLPEISLTPQMQKRLEDIFGKHLGVWHSKMSKKKKQEVLEGIYQGKISIVIGARSALFLPMQNLGAIIVDEEHDDSYKSQTTPRYNAKDLAIYLGQELNIPTILGSATPSLTSYFKAKNTHSIIKLPKHFSSSTSIQFLHHKTELSPPIIDQIHHSLTQQKQSLIFIPTRANFKSLLCSSCGSSIQCPFCSVSLSVHINKNLLLCHYCGFTQKIPHSCPQCQSLELSSHRIGSVQITNELQELFPKARIGIFDSDHIKTQKQLEDTLKKFANQELDILVGTQMLSKGHDYHNINLVVILGLDYVLSYGDFRSREKALSLFFQIKGRCGRKHDGLILTQTLQEEFFSYNSYEDFLLEELNFRQNLYPPFLKIATLTFSHSNPQYALNSMQRTIKHLQAFQDIQVAGGGKAGIEKINKKYRYMILLRSSKATYLIKAIHTIKEKCEIDIDPLNIV